MCRDLIFFFDREQEMKCTSTSRAALGPDAALMKLNNAFADRQAKPEAIHLTGQAIVHAVEALKDAVEVLGRNTQPIITDTDFKDVDRSFDIGLFTSSISP